MKNLLILAFAAAAAHPPRSRSTAFCTPTRSRRTGSLIPARRSSQRYSPLTQITPANVKNLELQWVFQARSLEKFEATPLVVDGIMYTVRRRMTWSRSMPPPAAIFWTYSYTPSPDARPCCGRVNRGLAILGDTLFMGTIDAHLIALDAQERQAALEHRSGESRKPVTRSRTRRWS